MYIICIHDNGTISLWKPYLLQLDAENATCKSLVDANRWAVKPMCVCVIYYYYIVHNVYEADKEIKEEKNINIMFRAHHRRRPSTAAAASAINERTYRF